MFVFRVADLLLGGAIMNKAMQPFESHIPYLLQMFIDYNLYGMNLLNASSVAFRRRKEGTDLYKVFITIVWSNEFSKKCLISIVLNYNKSCGYMLKDDFHYNVHKTSSLFYRR